MPFAQTETSTIHYTVTGQSEPTLLLIMGLGGHATEWGEPFLSRLRETFRVITMDNRGIAQSQTAVDVWTLDLMALDARAVLDAVGCDRAFIAGTSMGGMVAQLVALAEPERVQRLVLMSTNFGGPDAVLPGVGVAPLFTPVPGASPGQLQRRALTALTAPGFADANPEVIEEFARLRELTRTMPRVFQAQFNALLTSDRSALVRDITQPTLVVHGCDDVLIPAENGRLLADRIPGAELLLYERCGHFPHIEYPERLAEDLERFLL